MNYMKPFRFWCQKVLPLVYDDSLSYYELLCKVVDYLNHLGADVNELIQMVTDFQGIDLQDEVNKKLDEMAEDGSLDALLAKYVKNFTKLLVCVSTYRESIRTNAHDYCLAVSSDGGKTFMEMRDSDNFGDFPLGSDCSIAKVAGGYLFLATGAHMSGTDYVDFYAMFTKDFEHYVKLTPDLGFLQLCKSLTDDVNVMIGSPQVMESNGRYYLTCSIQTGNRSTTQDQYGYSYYYYPMWVYACEVTFDADEYNFSITKQSELFRLNVSGRTSIMDASGLELNGSFYLFYKDRYDLTVHLAKATSLVGTFTDVEKAVFEQIYLEACHMTKLSDTEALLYCTSYFHTASTDQTTQMFGYFDATTEKIIYKGEPLRANCHHFYTDTVRGNAIDCGMRNPYPIVMDSDMYMLLKEKFTVPTDIPTILDSDIPFRYMASPSNTIPQRAGKYLFETYGKYFRPFPWIYYDVSSDEDPVYVNGYMKFLQNASLAVTYIQPGNVSRTIRTGPTAEVFTLRNYAILPDTTLFNQAHSTLACGLGMYITQNLYTTTFTFRGLLTSALADGDIIGTKPDFLSSTFYWMTIPITSYDGDLLGSINVTEGGNIIYKGTALESGTRMYGSGSQVTR